MQILSLILTVLFFVFILAGIIWGVARGLKKTISRGIFLLLTSIILIFVTVPITKVLMNVNISVSDFTVNGKTIAGTMNLEEFLNLVLQSFLGNNFSHSNTIFESIYALIIGSFSSIVYLLLFWILKYALLPLNYLISKLIFRKKKQTAENLGFSAFGDDPNTPNPFDNLNLSNEENNNSVQLGSIFDPNNQPDEMPAPIVAEEPKKVDNSLFTQEVLDKRNAEAGLFIKDDTQIKNGATDTPPIELNLNTQQQDDASKNKKVKNKKDKSEKFLKPKENKYRFWGGMVGAVVGIIVMINTMVPFYGIINIIKNANQLELNNLSDTSISISSLTNGVTTQITDEYSKSVMGAVSQALGFEAIGLAEYDTITSIKIGGQKVTLRKDINQLLAVLKSVDDIAGYYKQIAPSGTLNNITQEQLDELLSRLNTILTKTKEVKFVDTLGDIVIPTICQSLVQTNFKPTDNVNINYLFTNTLKALSSAENVNLLNEFTSIVELIKYTNEQNLLLPIINSNTQNIFKNLSEVEENFASNFIIKLYNLKTVDIAMPNILNIGLTLLSESIDFEFERCELDGYKVKNDLSELFNALLSTANSFDKSSSSLITIDSLPPIGKLLNSIKDASFISNNTYNSLLDYASNELIKILEGSLPEELFNYANDVLMDNFKIVTDWENDLTNLKTAINILRDKENGIIGNIAENSDLRVGIHFNDFQVKETTLNNIGLALDKLQDTTLFGKTHSFKIDEESFTGDGVSRLVYYLLNIAKTSFDESDELKDITNTIDTMQNNLLNNYPENPGAKYWENEFKAISPLIEELYSMSDEEFQITATLGKNLDKATTSLLLGGDTTFHLVADMIDNVKTSEDTGVNGKINDLIDSIKTNLESPDSFENKTNFWHTELTHIDNLMSLEFDSNIKNNLVTIGSTLDNVVFGNNEESLRSSYLITHENIRKILSSAITENSDSLTSSFGDIKEPIENAIEKIKDNIENKTNYSFEFELSKLKTLSEIELSSSVFSYTDNQTILEQNKNTVISLGKKLDNISFNRETANNVISYNETKNSQVVTRSIINTLVSDLLSNINNKSSQNSEDTAMFTAIQSLILDIQNNIATANQDNYVFSWEREIGFIHILTEINSDNTFEFDTTGHENRLNLAENLDAIAFNTNTSNTKYDDIEFNENHEITYLPDDGNSLFITRLNLKATISNILDDIKEDDPDATTITKEDVINDLIDNTTSTISHETPADNTINGYSDFTHAFEALNIVEKTLTDKLDEVNGNSDITAINENGIINSLDETLQSFQNKPISGKIVTRKIALVILQQIEIPELLQTTKTGNYYNLLVSEFKENITSSATEVYYTNSEDDLSDLTNRNFPFRKLLNTLSE